MTYRDILKDHSPYIGYGFLHYFFSGLGQTFLISQFVPSFNGSLGIDNEQFGYIYSAATLLSALTLPWAGGIVDRVKVRYLSIINAFLISGFCLLTSISDHFILLFLALYGLRFTGQGFMVLLGSTALARYFDHGRGKALSLASFGISFSEMIMPTVVVASMAWVGWRSTFALLPLAVIAIFVPLVIILVGKKSPFQKPPEQKKDVEAEKDKTRGQVLRDPKFWILIPVSLFLPFFTTGMFIHQNLLASSMGWAPEWMATCFIAFGISRVLAYFIAGPLIDKFSARKVFIGYLAPLMVGVSSLLFFDHKWSGMVYMFFTGITASFAAVTNTALWAEIYGVRHLGAIKSTVTTLMVMSTALGPLVIGELLGDDGPGLDFTILVFLVVMLVMIIASALTIKRVEAGMRKNR